MSSEAIPGDARWRRLAAVAFGLAAAVTVGTVAWTSRDGAAPGQSPKADRGADPLAAMTGKPAAGASPMAAAPPGAPHELGAQQIAEMTQRLAERLEKKPDDPDGWAMLARSHAVSGSHAKAVEAFRKAVALRADDPVLLADFADALAMTQQRSLAGEPISLVLRALKLAPDNLKLLSLAGTEAFNRQDYAAAVRYWETLQTKGGADSVFFKQVQGGLDEARQRAAKP
jgi:cytochrome c-type biogenesis protein CcmH